MTMTDRRLLAYLWLSAIFSLAVSLYFGVDFVQSMRELFRG